MDLMTLDEFVAAASADGPPPGINEPLRALWHDARGDWDKAHEVAQEIPDPDGAWVHAYLHRKEGDAGNAAYWYRRARRPVAQSSLEDEWRELAEAFLNVER